MKFSISTQALRIFSLAALAVLAIFLASCSSNDGVSGSSSGRLGETTAANVQQAPTVPADTARTAAFAGVEKANEMAAGWKQDAELYAVASATPQVDAEGRAPAWLYTYVSPSAGAVASVSITGEKAKLLPEQSLPKDQIKDIADNTLPSPGKLLDSPEAMAKAGKVRKVLQSEPGKQTAVGLDSFSSEQPVWFLSTAQNGERVEERVTASKTGGS